MCYIGIMFFLYIFQQNIYMIHFIIVTIMMIVTAIFMMGHYSPSCPFGLLLCLGVCVWVRVCVGPEKKKKIGRGSVLCSSTTIFYSSIIICHSCSVDDKRVCVCVLISTEYIKNNNNNITIPFFYPLIVRAFSISDII